LSTVHRPWVQPLALEKEKEIELVRAKVYICYQSVNYLVISILLLLFSPEFI
jgi:hypothetical protein